MKFLRPFALLAGLVLALITGSARADGMGWFNYKSRFMLPEGRIIDTGNHNISHSEGQGFAMLLAVFYNDRPAFDQLLTWSDTHLYCRDIGLYSWRYDPAGSPPVSDINTASDGDTLIAWALLLAGRKWRQPSYTSASARLQAALIKHNVIHYAGYTVLLPGVAGFNQTGSVTLNPSYFIFPAWQAFYQQGHLKIWENLSADALTLLEKMRFGDPRLPTDWVTLRADKTVSPANSRPSRFSFDAVRVPLYIHWAQPKSPALEPYMAYWRRFDRLSTPAWVNVLTGERANYMLAPGMLAIRDAVLGNQAQVTDAILPQEDYYSASLHLLTFWSLK